jgi:hypothetical protein
MLEKKMGVQRDSISAIHTLQEDLSFGPRKAGGSEIEWDTSASDVRS